MRLPCYPFGPASSALRHSGRAAACRPRFACPTPARRWCTLARGRCCAALVAPLVSRGEGTGLLRPQSSPPYEGGEGGGSIQSLSTVSEISSIANVVSLWYHPLREARKEATMTGLRAGTVKAVSLPVQETGLARESSAALAHLVTTDAKRLTLRIQD